MSKSKLVRYGAGPLLLAGLAAPAMLSGCGDDIGPGGCGATLKARVEAFQGAVTALTNVSAEIKGNIAVACNGIASDLGMDPPPVDGANTSDDDLSANCDMAAAGLDAAIAAEASFSIQVIGGQCSVKAEAQLNCEASCQVDASCDPGSVEVRCDPGELSGECSAECSGSCTVTSGSVTCEGGCEGTCSGQCMGTCETMGGGGMCDGKCEGTCMGECTGTCDVVPPSATCSGSCKGGCSVEYTAPQCEAKLEPPSCEVDADCSAGCEGSATLEAECTPPQIVIEASASLAATLETHLPAIFLVFETQGELVVDVAADIAGKAVGVAEGVIAEAGCALEYGAGLVAEFEAAATASASVSVSVEASAEVGGSASSG